MKPQTSPWDLIKLGSVIVYKIGQALRPKQGCIFTEKSGENAGTSTIDEFAALFAVGVAPSSNLLLLTSGGHEGAPGQST